MDTVEKVFLVLFAIMLIPYLTGLIFLNSFNETILNPDFVAVQVEKNNLYEPLKGAVAGATVKQLVAIKAIPEEKGGQFMDIVRDEIHDNWLEDVTEDAIDEIYYLMENRKISRWGRSHLKIDTYELKSNIKPKIIDKMQDIGSQYNISPEESGERIEMDFPEEIELEEYMGFFKEGVPLNAKANPAYPLLLGIIGPLSGGNTLSTTSDLFSAGKTLMNFGIMFLFICAVALLVSIGMITSDLKNGIRAVSCSLAVAAIFVLALSSGLSAMMMSSIKTEKIPAVEGLSSSQIENVINNVVSTIFSQANFYAILALIIALLLVSLSFESVREKLKR